MAEPLATAAAADFALRYGPWAVIAGASEGTGRSFARRIAAAGINCVLVGRREAPLLVLAEEISAQSGVETALAVVDLAQPDAAERISAVVASREVGLFVSNAGAIPTGRCSSTRTSPAGPAWFSATS